MTRDHFTSQLYLHGFTDPASPNPNDPGVWVVDRRYPGKPKWRSPSNIAWEHDYNTWSNPFSTRKVVSLEKEYGELEDWAAPIIRKLDKRDTRLSCWPGSRFTFPDVAPPDHTNSETSLEAGGRAAKTAQHPGTSA